MACTITLFNYLGGPPQTGGTWVLTSGGPVDLSVNGGATSTYSNGNPIGVTHTVTIGVNDTAAGTYVFTYTVGSSPCDDTATVTVTVVDGAVAGTSNTYTYCSSDGADKNLYSLLGMSPTPATDGVWSGIGTTASGYVAGTASGTDNTFNPMAAGVGTYPFTYTVDNGDGTTPGGCDNCVDTAELTINVVAAGNAGTDGNVTLCNTP